MLDSPRNCIGLLSLWSLSSNFQSPTEIRLGQFPKKVHFIQSRINFFKSFKSHLLNQRITLLQMIFVLNEIRKGFRGDRTAGHPKTPMWYYFKTSIFRPTLKYFLRRLFECNSKTYQKKM